MTTDTRPVAFELSTDDREELTFGIDEKLYTIHSYRQLTPNEAGRLSVIYRRLNILAEKQAKEEDEGKLNKITDEVQRLQDELLKMMSDVPDEVRAKLRTDHRNIILKHVSQMSIDHTQDVKCKVCERMCPVEDIYCARCGDKLDKLEVIDGEVRELPAGEEKTGASEV